MKYRKKPIIINAIQYDGDNLLEIITFVGKGLAEDLVDDILIIPTLEGDMKASKGDWIIEGVNGEFYPCKPDIFEKTYDKV